MVMILARFSGATMQLQHQLWTYDRVGHVLLIVIQNQAYVHCVDYYDRSKTNNN
jgi:hypothetical protein